MTATPFIPALPASGQDRAAPTRVARLVAARLSELGRPADLVSVEAVESLGREAGGSEDRLWALLTSALFIASTEDAEHVGAEHVLRAAELLEPREAESRQASGGPAGPVPVNGPLFTGPRPEASLPVQARWPQRLAAGWLMAALILLVIAGVRFAERGPNLVVVEEALAPTAIIASTAIAPAAHGHARLPIAALLPSAPVLAAPASPEAGRPDPLDAVLPVQPPAAVVIRYTVGNPSAAALVQSMARRLEAAGMSPSFALATRGMLTQPSISYYYDEDRPAAVLAAAAAGPGMLPPRLMNPLEGTTLRPPGTIEIAVP